MTDIQPDRIARCGLGRSGTRPCCSSLLLGTQPIAGSLVDGDRARARGDNDVVTGQVVRELLVFEDCVVHGQRLPVDRRRGSVRRGADGVGRSRFARLDTSVNVVPVPTRWNDSTCSLPGRESLSRSI